MIALFYDSADTGKQSCVPDLLAKSVEIQCTDYCSTMALFQLQMQILYSVVNNDVQETPRMIQIL